MRSWKFLKDIFVVDQLGLIIFYRRKLPKELLKKKVNNIESLKPDFISTGNIGCITQISNGTQTPILHTIEVLDWYTGGPKPKILQKN
jgi:glycolate oxidase iron-sulfur subunit